jgi:pyruvate formate lyase activating enzyme
MVKGYVHSYESGAMVDGPGIRFVIFFSGCPLRCQYCHNPDTWDMKKGGTQTDSSDILAKIKSTSGFIKSSGGGVTISGGEPLMQPEFLAEILKGCKEIGLNTAVDTSGYLVKNLNDEILKNTDLFLVDIKSYNAKTYKEVTGAELAPTLEFIGKLQQYNKHMWIRFVLVPGLTDNLDDIQNMAVYVSKIKNVDRLEVLPFHKLGEFKWKELGYDYKLSNTKIPTIELVEKVKKIFKDQGITTY